jgi:cell division protein FtsQ
VSNGMSDGDGGRRWRLVRAGTDAVPESLRRLFFPRSAGRRSAPVPWRLVAATLATMGFLAWLIFASPVLGVRIVRVEGLSFLDEAQVREVAGVLNGTPLTRVDVDGVAQRIAALPAVAGVEVSRDWPSTLRIAVVERVPIGGLKRDNTFHLFDAQAVIFRTTDSLPADVVAVECQADNLVKAAVTVIEALTPQLRSELVRLSIDGPAGITLVLNKDRMVTWGDEQRSELKAKVATALLKQKGTRIDVSVPEIVTIQ